MAEVQYCQPVYIKVVGKEKYLSKEKFGVMGYLSHDFAKMEGTKQKATPHSFIGVAGNIKHNANVFLRIDAPKDLSSGPYLGDFKDTLSHDCYYYDGNDGIDNSQYWRIEIEGQTVLKQGSKFRLFNLQTKAYLTADRMDGCLHTTSSSSFSFEIVLTDTPQKPIIQQTTMPLRQIPTASRENDGIQHVVVVMMENRSFFRLLGNYVNDPNRDSYTNIDTDGNVIKSKGTRERKTADPPHEILPVLSSIDGLHMGGFVKEYERAQKFKLDMSQKQDLMGYWDAHLPAVEAFIQCGTVCDRWFASIPGPTWPNRMFAYAGTSLGWVTTPNDLPLAKDLIQWYSAKTVPGQDKTIHDSLMKAAASPNRPKPTSSIYKGHNDVPCLARLLYMGHTPDAGSMSDFEKNAAAGKLENFCWIEPDYTVDKNDDHPPHDPLLSQAFIARVYNALRKGPNWKNTMLVVTYDEHGGFFDPIVPPAAPVPDPMSEKDPAFASLGVRVPTFIVSPRVAKGIDSTVYDHTSVLKYVLEKFAPERVNNLGKRVASANSFNVLSTPRPDSEFPESINVTVSPEPVSPVDAKTLATFRQNLESIKQTYNSGAECEVEVPDRSVKEHMCMLSQRSTHSHVVEPSPATPVTPVSSLLTDISTPVHFLLGSTGTSSQKIKFTRSEKVAYCMTKKNDESLNDLQKVIYTLAEAYHLNKLESGSQVVDEVD